MKKNSIISFTVVAVLVAVMVLYKPDTGQDFVPHGATDNQQATVSDAIDEAQIAPDFTLSTHDGGEITLSQYRGDKPVILDFWASWCHNCERALPKTEKLYEKYKDQVEIIGINLNETKGAVDRYLEEQPLSFPIALDNNRVSRLYGNRYTNTHVMINMEGEIVEVFSRDLTEEDILKLLEV